MRIALAILLAAAAALLPGEWNVFAPAVILGEGCRAAADIFLAGAQLLAVPMVIAAAVDSLVGLDAVRGLRRLGWKTLAGFTGASLLALLVAGILEGVFRLDVRVESLLPASAEALPFVPPRPEGIAGQRFTLPPALWPALVLLSLGFGFYRNQIGEGRAHLLLRFWRGVDDTASLFVEWSRWLVPFGVFALVYTMLADSDTSMLLNGEFLGPLASVAACWMIYAGMVLPAVLWLVTRVNPWKYALSLAPAILTALGSGNLPATLPLAFDQMRRRTGVSNRVTSVVLPLGASLQRDGVALGWTALALYFAADHGLSPKPGELISVGACVWLASIVGGGFNGGSGVSIAFVASVLQQSARVQTNPEYLLLMGLCIHRGGAAVSLWSQACVAAIVAHWEGERDLLTPRPPSDPFFGERLAKDFV